MPVEMRFQNPISKDLSTFSTVRRGVKWGVIETGTYVEVVEVEKAEGGLHPEAMVISVVTKRFVDLVASDLVDNFEKDCRYFGGIYKRMKEIYPDFDKFEIVTVIRFEAW